MKYLTREQRDRKDEVARNIANWLALQTLWQCDRRDVWNAWWGNVEEWDKRA